MREFSNVECCLAEQRVQHNEIGRRFRCRDEKGNLNADDDEGYVSKSKKSELIRDAGGELGVHVYE
jgi:hypothetical protein